MITTMDRVRRTWGAGIKSCLKEGDIRVISDELGITTDMTGRCLKTGKLPNEALTKKIFDAAVATVKNHVHQAQQIISNYEADENLTLEIIEGQKQVEADKRSRAENR